MGFSIKDYQCNGLKILRMKQNTIETEHFILHVCRKIMTKKCITNFNRVSTHI